MDKIAILAGAMSQPSNWPLPAGSSRIVLPLSVLPQLAAHPFSAPLYPLAYGHYVHAAGHSVQRDEHTDTLLIYCYRGAGYYQTAYAAGRLQAGQLLLLPSGVGHHYRASRSEPWSIYWMHCEGHALPALLAALHYRAAQPWLSVATAQPLLPWIHALLQLSSQTDPFASGLRAANLLQRLLLELSQQRPQPSSSAFALEPLQGFIDAQQQRSLSLAELAQFAGLSPFHFSKRFKAATGISPIRYVNQYKIRQACLALDSSTASIRAIAAQFGFDDPYYFSRLFKKIMGMSPQAYRSTQRRR